MTTRVVRHLPSLDRPPGPLVEGGTVVTLGNFDGVHRGHRQLLEELLDQKNQLKASLPGIKSVLITFYPHPATVLASMDRRPPLRTLHHFTRILSEAGLDVLVLVHFTKKLSLISAEDCVKSFFFRQLNCQALVVGEDAAIGHRRKGDVRFLTKSFHDAGRICRVVEFSRHAGEKIGSRQIRAMLAGGDYAGAIKLLEEPLVLESYAKKGQQLGRTIGFPTINCEHFHQLIPKYGIYTSLTEIEGKIFKGVTSVGIRPTVTDSKFVVETHLFENPGFDCYGKKVRVALLHRLRDELKFENLEKLKSAIAADVQQARSLLQSVKENTDAMYSLPV